MSYPGFVYLLSASNGMHKIGRSTDPRKRVKSLSGMPYSVELVHKIETSDMLWLEKEMHRKHRDKRITGEWFLLSQVEVDGFCRIHSMDPPPQDRTTAFGDNLKRLRKEAGLSQKELGEKIGERQPQVVIGRWERGDVVPRWDSVMRLCEALGCGPEEFTRQAEES